MNLKGYLLIAGNNYYPSSGTDDWIKTFETLEEAQSKVTRIDHKRIITKGKRKGEEEITYTSYSIEVNGSKYDYDWYEIIDLMKWIMG